jgi:hypothetical protein
MDSPGNEFILDVELNPEIDLQLCSMEARYIERRVVLGYSCVDLGFIVSALDKTFRIGRTVNIIQRYYSEDGKPNVVGFEIFHNCRIIYFMATRDKRFLYTTIEYKRTESEGIIPSVADRRKLCYCT